MAYNKSEKGDSPMKRRGGRRRKKVCVFCGCLLYTSTCWLYLRRRGFRRSGDGDYRPVHGTDYTVFK